MANNFSKFKKESEKESIVNSISNIEETEGGMGKELQPPVSDTQNFEISGTGEVDVIATATGTVGSTQISGVAVSTLDNTATLTYNFLSTMTLVQDVAIDVAPSTITGIVEVI